ncbi:hypothetical protein XENTR_v10001722 [Xenopus tropicalis]|nr:hypothetical protein XENTR_v10001722 [Xenopus tropicalis]
MYKPIPTNSVQQHTLFYNILSISLSVKGSGGRHVNTLPLKGPALVTSNTNAKWSFSTILGIHLQKNKKSCIFFNLLLLIGPLISSGQKSFSHCL